MRYFELYSFAHILTDIYFRLSHRGQLRVRGYIRDGLRPAGRPFPRLLMSLRLPPTFGHLDLMLNLPYEGRSQFDFLSRKENIELEVDCKIASADIGRKIHQRQTLELWRRLNPVLHQWADRCMAHAGYRYSIHTSRDACLHERSVQSSVAGDNKGTVYKYVRDSRSVRRLFKLRSRPALCHCFRGSNAIGCEKNSSA